MKFSYHIQKYSFLFMTILFMGAMSCSKKDVKEEPGFAPNDAPAQASTEEAQPAPTPQTANADQVGKPVAELEMIFFPYDSDHLTQESLRVLNKNADFLKANPTLNIQIEGYCDERGTEEYNRALGERRAEAVKNYLINSLSIGAERLTTFSYGEDKPLDPGHNEAAWAKNRRAVFVSN